MPDPAQRESKRKPRTDWGKMSCPIVILALSAALVGRMFGNWSLSGVLFAQVILSWVANWYIYDSPFWAARKQSKALLDVGRRR